MARCPLSSSGWILGILQQSARGTSYEPGQIVITGVTEPWPDGAALRRTLDEAFQEAGEIEAEQSRRALELQRHLRDSGQQ
jgi:hypothetical protein